MRFDISTHQGAGSITFGMSPADARAQVGATFKSFKRTPQSTFPCDFFPSLGVFLYYTAQGQLEAIEFASPAQPHFQGSDLLKLSFSDLVALLSAVDPKIDIRDDGFTSRACGIGAYAPDASEDPAQPVETVLAFSASYYD
jgi:hypothetical protein